MSKPHRMAVYASCLLAISTLHPLTAQALEPEAEAFLIAEITDLNLANPSPQVELDFRGTSTQAVWVEGAEAVVFDSSRFRAETHAWNHYEGQVLAVRGAAGKTVKGKLVLRIAEGQHETADFTAVLKQATDDSRKAFWHPWRRHYSSFGARPGSAWFRYQVRRAEQALGMKESANRARTRRFFGTRSNTAEDTLALMSGGTAVSENLQLDREIPIRGEEGSAVALDSLKGITISEFDWSKLTSGLEPAVDPLAHLVPADQHALFVPSFAALVRLVDDAEENGTPLVRIGAPQAEDARSRERYERQLCLSLSTAARLIGPKLVDSIVVTGGDAYFRTGTDVAVLLETKTPEALVALLKSQQKVAFTSAKLKSLTVESVEGTLGTLDYTGVKTDNREICSYIAKIDGAVVVTNSLAQLQRIAETAGHVDLSLINTPEYTFFRDRYPLVTEEETALLILSDATIRRWCGPRWRIGASRRTRVAAAMAEVQSSHMQDLVAGDVPQQQVTSRAGVARGVPFSLEGKKIWSEDYGDLTFLTPISEMQFTSISQEEARMYRRWRDGYERNWSNFFDPIAVRLSLKDNAIAADLTVMPLIDRSRYEQLQELSKGSKLDQGVGDPHPEALLQWMLALNPESPQLKMYTNLLRGMAPQIQVDPLSWVGNGVSLYLDNDPLWKEAMEAEDPDDFIENNMHRLPLAAHIEVRNAFKLTLFMTGVRAFVEQTVPGLSIWEPKQHKDEHYVKVTATERAGIPVENFALFYAASGEGLTITFSEPLIHRALERRVTRRKAADEDNSGDAESSQAEDQAIAKGIELPWPDQNVALRVSRQGLTIIEELFGRGYHEEMRRMSYKNLPVLNEWKRLFPELDPVDVHQQFWQRRLVCPSGGQYVWNDKLKTMESSVYGSPLQPTADRGPSIPPALKKLVGGDFGLEFEENGLRARVSIERE